MICRNVAKILLLDYNLNFDCANDERKTKNQSTDIHFNKKKTGKKIDTYEDNAIFRVLIYKNMQIRTYIFKNKSYVKLQKNIKHREF